MKGITLVAIDFKWHDLTRYAIEHTLKHVDVADIITISDVEIMSPARSIIRSPVANMAEYAAIMLKDIAEHVTTDHALYVQWDGMANNSRLWTNEYLKYDYIGAPWPWEPEGRNVGNGGFSLRSRRLLDACADNIIQISEKRQYTAEDAAIGIDHRPYLEKTHGIRYAPTGIARQFSYEFGPSRDSFGFHGIWNVFKSMPLDDQYYYASTIDYTGWTVGKWHAVLMEIIVANNTNLLQLMMQKLVENSESIAEAVVVLLKRDCAARDH